MYHWNHILNSIAVCHNHADKVVIYNKTKISCMYITFDNCEQKWETNNCYTLQKRICFVFFLLIEWFNFTKNNTSILAQFDALWAQENEVSIWKKSKWIIIMIIIINIFCKNFPFTKMCALKYLQNETWCTLQSKYMY